MENYVNICDFGIAGECPYCNSSDTDYFKMFISGNNGFTEIWCNTCGEMDNSTTRNMLRENCKVYTENDYLAHQERRKNGEYLSLTPSTATKAERLAVAQAG